MKETIFMDHFNNACDLIFSENVHTESGSIVLGLDQQLTNFRADNTLESVADKYWNLFKKVFAFIPGILMIHIVMPGLFTFGINLWTLFFIASGIFLTWAGIGDLKKRNNILIPGVGILLGLILSLPFYLLPVSLFDYGVYMYVLVLPLFFVTPILTKDYLDANEKS